MLSKISMSSAMIYAHGLCHLLILINKLAVCAWTNLVMIRYGPEKLLASTISSPMTSLSQRYIKQPISVSTHWASKTITTHFLLEIRRVSSEGKKEEPPAWYNKRNQCSHLAMDLMGRNYVHFCSLYTSNIYMLECISGK